jgi:fructokinase
MRDWGMDTSGLQVDPLHPTGRVNVAFVDDENVYDIVRPSAWDAIEPEAQAADCRLLYHGSLGLREAVSRQTLQQLGASKPETVFIDVNLRPPWWQREQVQDMLRTADWVKLNSDELALLHPSAGSATPGASDFLGEYGLSGLVLTHGAQGAELMTDTGEYFKVRPGSDIEVVDTVGAGDAFASVIILGLSNDWPLDITLQRAQLFASKMVGNRGATVGDMAFYQPLINEWSTRA